MRLDIQGHAIIEWALQTLDVYIKLYKAKLAHLVFILCAGVPQWMEQSQQLTPPLILLRLYENFLNFGSVTPDS